MTFPLFEHPDLHAAFRDPGANLGSFLQHPVNGDAFLHALSERHPAPCHQAGGDATPVHGPVEYEAATAALGGGIRGADPRLLAEQARWTLVAQIDTDDRAGMMRGGCGALYWLFRRDEMTASRWLRGPGAQGSVTARPGRLIVPGGHYHVMTSTAGRPASTAGSASASCMDRFSEPVR